MTDAKLPELPEGWEWASDTSGHVARYGSPDRASYTHDVWIYDNQRLVSSLGAVASGNTPAAVALAVLDANGLNTTAEHWKKEAHAAMVEMAKVRQSAQELQSSYDWAWIGLFADAEERGGQFQLLYKRAEHFKSENRKLNTTANELRAKVAEVISELLALAETSRVGGASLSIDGYAGCRFDGLERAYRNAASMLARALEAVK